MSVRSILLSLTRGQRVGQFRSLSIPVTITLIDESHSNNNNNINNTPPSKYQNEDNNDDYYDNSGEEDASLKGRIMRVRLPKRSATNVLQKWVSEGRPVGISDLRETLRELRKDRRYKHALEVSEWMVGHEEYESSDSDHAVRIDLMTKVFGIDAAERYFEGLPNNAKTSETYTAMLHSYAGSKLIEKAEDLYERAKRANLSLTALTYNEMMTLYMSVGQAEKVPLVIEDLKKQNVVPDLFTYNLWISSFAAKMDIERVKSILDEMVENPGSDEGWASYIKLANVYIKSGNFVSGGSSSLVDAEKSISQREWVTYDFLMILYTGLGKKELIDQIWKSLMMTKQKMTSRNYVCVLASYLMLGNLKEVGKVIDQWKQSSASEFDIFACNRLIKAFLDHDLIEKAESFRILLSEKGCDTM